MDKGYSSLIPVNIQVDHRDSLYHLVFHFLEQFEVDIEVAAINEFRRPASGFGSGVDRAFHEISLRDFR